MTGDDRAIMDRLRAAASAEALSDAPATAFGARRLFWQRFEPDVVQTWDRFPAGFFEHYYGTDADRECAVAKAVRARWSIFSFQEARAQFDRPGGGADLSRRVWEAFGVEDGVVVAGGRRDVDSIVVFGLEEAGSGARLIASAAPALRFAAALFDGFLFGAEDQLIAIPRRPVTLSEGMQAVLRVAIDHPTASLQEQAALLEISPRMLEKRHRQIAKRFGVTSFAGAVAVAVRDAVQVGRSQMDGPI